MNIFASKRPSGLSAAVQSPCPCFTGRSRPGLPCGVQNASPAGTAP